MTSTIYHLNILHPEGDNLRKEINSLFRGRISGITNDGLWLRASRNRKLFSVTTVSIDHEGELEGALFAVDVFSPIDTGLLWREPDIRTKRKFRPDFKQFRDETVMIELFATDPSVKGQGVGSKILKAFEEYAKNNGKKIAFALVDGEDIDEQRKLLEYYEAHGYSSDEKGSIYMDISLKPEKERLSNKACLIYKHLV